MAFFHLLQRYDQPIPSMNQGDVLSVKFEIYSEEQDEKPVLTGVVDWQDGVNFYYQQFMNPGDFTAIMAAAFEAVKMARLMIGENWCQDEPQ